MDLVLNKRDTHRHRDRPRHRLITRDVDHLPLTTRCLLGNDTILPGTLLRVLHDPRRRLCRLTKAVALGPPLNHQVIIITITLLMVTGLVLQPVAVRQEQEAGLDLLAAVVQLKTGRHILIP